MNVKPQWWHNNVSLFLFSAYSHKQVSSGRGVDAALDPGSQMDERELKLLSVDVTDPLDVFLKRIRFCFEG